MENDPIISLRQAIEELTTEIRSMRGAGVDDASNASPSDESVVANESADPGQPISTQPAIEPEGSGITDTAAASLAELNEEAGKAQQELDQLVLALGEKESELASSRDALKINEQTVQELEARKSKLAIDVEDLEGRVRQIQILQQESSALEEHLRAMKSEEADLEQKRRFLASQEEGLRIGLEKVEHAGELLRKLWPEWLCGEDLRHWKELIEKDVFTGSSPPSFSLLFAAIHNYNASLRDPDNRILLDALRDLGRRLYQWLKDLGKSEESTADVAEAWAAAINTECVERCAIQVAVPGNPANNKWMSFTPRSGSAPDVASVRSWCVSDTQGRPIHRAEVVV